MTDIQHRGRFLQVVDFSGLKIGNTKPSDVDCAMELDGKAFAILEFKLGDTDVPVGQRLLIARLIDGLAAGGAAALGIVASHGQYPCNKDIDGGAAIVREYRWRGKWHVAGDHINVRDALHSFFRRHSPDGYWRLTGGEMASRNRLGSTNSGAGDRRYGENGNAL